jgi:sphingomyelin phosphodiesterase acid-like 3
MESYIYKTVRVYLSETKIVNEIPPGGVPPLAVGATARLVTVLPLLALAAVILSGLSLPAQTAGMRSSGAPSAIHALFLSDIHFDPYGDPAKVARLNAAPAVQWDAIFAAPSSATRADDAVALQKVCPVRGVDTPDVLWQSSLEAIYRHAYAAQFVTVSGDLLAHSFDCKYKALLPNATHADYLAFVEKTIQYVVVTLHTKVSSSIPIYIALGNNDSGCTDYQLDPGHDEFLALTAKIVAEALPGDLSQAERESVLRDFSAGGYYSVPLAGVPHARLIVLDDLFLSSKYATCAGRPDPAPGAAQLAWLEAELALAREHKERVWVMGHIPPGVDPYSTIRNLPRVCLGGQSTMFLGSEALPEILAHNSDIIRLAIFGHTHSDEMRLLTVEVPPGSAPAEMPTTSIPAGVPVKVVASITPVNGNRPTFTLASIDPASANLVDYTVIMASNLTGVDTTWSPEYTYSAAYHQPAFDSASVSSLIAGFHADPSAKTPESQAYLRNYYPGDVSAMIQFAWPQYACSMDHDSGASFAACACSALK